ncbi:MAG: RNA methyltransferase [Planctomycetota bacterium]
MSAAPRDVIRSASNPVFQRVRAVRAGKERELVLLEGARLVADARALGLSFDLLLLEEGRPDTAGLPEPPSAARFVARALMQRLSGLETSPGVLALVERPARLTLDALDLTPRGGVAGLALAVAGIADPGNLGALARSAEAAGARALIVVRGGARPFGEKALRGSMGALLRLPVIEVDDAAEALRALALRGVHQVAASVGGGTPYTAFDFSPPLVLWMPGEVGEVEQASGISAALKELPRIRIPMAGQVESLNVTVAASLLLFAAGRAPRA